MLGYKQPLCIQKFNEKTRHVNLRSQPGYSPHWQGATLVDSNIHWERIETKAAHTWVTQGWMAWRNWPSQPILVCVCPTGLFKGNGHRPTPTTPRGIIVANAHACALFTCFNIQYIETWCVCRHLLLAVYSLSICALLLRSIDRKKLSLILGFIHYTPQRSLWWPSVQFQSLFFETFHPPSHAALRLTLIGPAFELFSIVSFFHRPEQSRIGHVVWHYHMAYARAGRQPLNGQKSIVKSREEDNFIDCMLHYLNVSKQELPSADQRRAARL